MKISVEVTGDNEGTESPWWAVVDPVQNMRADLAVAAGQITGPFFSRAEGEEYLKRRRYEYSKRAAVWCFSGYWSEQWKNAMRKAIDDVKAYEVREARCDAQDFRDPYIATPIYGYAEARRPCTCKGTCGGKEGLGPNYVCALDLGGKF